MDSNLSTPFSSGFAAPRRATFCTVCRHMVRFAPASVRFAFCARTTRCGIGSDRYRHSATRVLHAVGRITHARCTGCCTCLRARTRRALPHCCRMDSCYTPYRCHYVLPDQYAFCAVFAACHTTACLPRVRIYAAPSTRMRRALRICARALCGAPPFVQFGLLIRYAPCDTFYVPRALPLHYTATRGTWTVLVRQHCSAGYKTPLRLFLWMDGCAFGSRGCLHAYRTRSVRTFTATHVARSVRSDGRAGLRWLRTHRAADLVAHARDGLQPHHAPLRTHVYAYAYPLRIYVAPPRALRTAHALPLHAHFAHTTLPPHTAPHTCGCSLRIGSTLPHYYRACGLRSLYRLRAATRCYRSVCTCSITAFGSVYTAQGIRRTTLHLRCAFGCLGCAVVMVCHTLPLLPHGWTGWMVGWIGSFAACRVPRNAAHFTAQAWFAHAAAPAPRMDLPVLRIVWLPRHRHTSTAAARAAAHCALAPAPLPALPLDHYLFLPTPAYTAAATPLRTAAAAAPRAAPSRQLHLRHGCRAALPLHRAPLRILRLPRAFSWILDLRAARAHRGWISSCAGQLVCAARCVCTPLDSSHAHAATRLCTSRRCAPARAAAACWFLCAPHGSVA